MEYNGITLPGIVSPDENIENFGKLYGNGSHEMMLLMASPLGNPYGLPDKSVRESNNSRDLSNSNRRSPRYGLQAPYGSRAMRHGVPYNPLPAIEHHRPRYSHHKEGYEFPRAFQRVEQQPKKPFRVAEHQNQYSFPYPARYAWL